jgi:tetratricopeptide (TPR) repeat protein
MCIFHPPSLVKFNLFETSKKIGYFKPILDSYQYYSFVDDFPLDIAIHQLEQVNNENPTDWLIKYLLGDWYIRAKLYSKAVTILEQALSLRPQDIRSTYALATAYRILTRARLIGIPKEELTESSIHILGIDFDPEASNKEINKHGITLDDAAFKAMGLFEETMRLGVRASEKEIVFESLQKMYSDFPHLEVQVKNQRKLKFLGDARKGSGGIFNDAMSHYSRLRFLLNTPPRYRYELAEVIRLSLWAIATDNHDGDSYILLANAYSLLDNCVSFTAKDPEYYPLVCCDHSPMGNNPIKTIPFFEKCQDRRSVISSDSLTFSTYTSFL